MQVCSDQRGVCRIALKFVIRTSVELVEYWKNIIKIQTLRWLLIVSMLTCFS